MPQYKVEVRQYFVRVAEVEIEIHENPGPETEDEIGDIVADMQPEEFGWSKLMACEVEIIDYNEVVSDPAGKVVIK